MKPGMALALFLVIWMGSGRTSVAEAGPGIRRLLAQYCLECHGPDPESRKADLRLDTQDGLFSHGKTGPVIDPGQPGTSELFRRISSQDPDVRMPPAEHSAPLPDPIIQQFKSWILQGATLDSHWAFNPLSQSPGQPSASPSESGSLAPIDMFVGQKLENIGLAPNETELPGRLLRRLALDLTGLPPHMDDVLAFESDPTLDHYEKFVDQYLSDPAYGERWATQWMDLARYADTRGFEKDLRRTIWRYRDWVIEAFNEDMPYDRFTIAQLAGDLMPDSQPSDWLATAFHRNTMTNDEGGTDDEEWRIIAVKDRVDTTFQVWMGLTVGCAKCHSHKYDPISQKEYYQLFAFFNQSRDADRYDDAPNHPFPTRIQEKHFEVLNSRLSALRQSPDPDDANLNAEAQIREELKKLEESWPRIPIMQDLMGVERRTTRIHNRGNFLDPGDSVEPATPEAFHRFENHWPKDRYGLAQWIVHPGNPLTARVQVNRVWAQFFGRGLVGTEEDFGTQGAHPSHEELLNWLAREFQAHGWSMKWLCRTIALSATYRQSSQFSAEKLAADPDNSLLSRGPRFRLTSESIRDASLFVSGLLNRELGGPSEFPYQPDGIWQTVYSQDQWVPSPGQQKWKRGLYTFIRRTSPYPARLTFDGSSRESCLIRRIRSNTPLQALITLNDPVYVEAAQYLAHRVLSNPGLDSFSAKIQWTLLTTLSRRPTPEESQLLHNLYQQRLNYYQTDTNAARQMCPPSTDLPEDALADLADLAAWTNVMNVVLNLDEFLCKP